MNHKASHPLFRRAGLAIGLSAAMRQGRVAEGRIMTSLHKQRQGSATDKLTAGEKAHTPSSSRSACARASGVLP